MEDDFYQHLKDVLDNTEKIQKITRLREDYLQRTLDNTENLNRDELIAEMDYFMQSVSDILSDQEFFQVFELTKADSLQAMAIIHKEKLA